MGFYPPRHHRISPPRVVLAPRPREHALDDFLARMNIEEGDDQASTLFAAGATISSDAGEGITGPDATAHLACPQDFMNSTERTQAEHAASECMQDDLMATPPILESTTAYANPNNVARGHRIALTRPFDATLAQQSAHPLGGYAHVHDGWYHHPQDSQTPRAMGALMPGPLRREAHTSLEMESLTPQLYLGNVGADTVSDPGGTAAAATLSVRYQVEPTPSFNLPSSVRLPGDPEEHLRNHHGNFQARSRRGATALDRIDEISSHDASATQCADQHDLIEPGRTPSQGLPAQSAVSIGLGLQLYREDADYAMAP